ncbi:uncharacterized protein HMPREF1541_08913 [Cyphellophora europaea CBS 101466]|uniref:Trafficking protein particle complex subunit 11 domain-containing protein n=1 Tax=Cyphellophora europaea (strain CBS 101466) TaxID=1220924 RepID=W2RJW3_CYPE1|nr:uncharacterized protein HMPREF1541_08913 [Cyphellophora europaea CBS 101466]ETN36635.1 hypothetical protein HMPREF1541_08913 [Cyphellophora europaea CBS 101466]
MDAFGDDYIAHNLPLLFLSGLGSSNSTRDPGHRHPAPEGGFRVRTDLPPLESDLANVVKDAFLQHDGSLAPWRTPPVSSRFFAIRNVGRSYTLPPRKAPPPPHSPRLSAVDNGGGPPPALVLHSPLSPLTPSSPLYPDGVLNQQWIAKHQHHLPCAVVMFLPLSADAHTSSLLDNKIKSEINSAKAALSTANYKTRLVVVLLGDEILSLDDVEDRIATIRRATNMDQKALYFIAHDSLPQQASQVVQSLLGSLYPQCIEYYRDLSKHARRKRNRNVTPQPTIPPASAHVLASQGWVVRYEFKLGVFGEFRQEMDAACRNYETAYDSLFAAEMIESIASWSPRFHEARLLADTIALRILRCLLWTGQTSAAVRSWTNHQERIEGLLDRRGKGTENYGWQAWQHTWSKTMAELLTRSELPGLSVTVPASDSLVFLKPDASAGERFTPWEHLHHQGYWLRNAQEHTKERRKLAATIPDEDRHPPGRSPASKLTHTAESYDSYLTLEPYQELPADGTTGFDYTEEILVSLDAAIEYFDKKGQVRMNELIQMKKASEFLNTQAWSQAVQILQPLWESPVWRKSGWWRLLECVGWALLDCANELQALELIVRLTWELANSCFTARPNTIYDLDQLLERFAPENKLSIALNSQEGTGRIATSFAFSTAQGHVGELIDCQFVLSSCSNTDSSAVSLSGVKIVFEGSLKPIYLHPSDSATTSKMAVSTADVELNEASPLSSTGNKRSSVGHIASVSGPANLTLAAGQTRIFNMQMIPREAGDVSVASITLMLEIDRLSLTVTNSEVEGATNDWWEMKGDIPVPRAVGTQRVVSNLHVLPKPPKVEINAVDFKRSYYTNENVEINIEIVNNEEETALPTVRARLISPVNGAAKIRWADQGDDEATEELDIEQILPPRKLDSLRPGSKSMLSLQMSETVAALDHELEIVVTYNLEADTESVLQKVLTLDLAVIRPFEANYDFAPRITSETWPNYFAPPPASPDIPSGLTQQFLVTANLFSFAIEPIDIEAILLTTTKITGGAICSSTTGVLRDETLTEPAGLAEKISASIAPEQTRSFNFDLTVQKQVLGDRHTVALDLALEIGWRRPGSNGVNSSILEVPRFVVPMAEPRVLVTVDNKASVPGQEDMKLMSLRYIIENPSMHFLTFNVAMEASEDFAFSGPKANSVSLVPISKYEMVYKILPNKRDTEGSRERRKNRDAKGEWLKVQLNVVDAYFNQSLRVQPAGGGVRLDKKGGVVVLMD